MHRAYVAPVPWIITKYSAVKENVKDDGNVARAVSSFGRAVVEAPSEMTPLGSLPLEPVATERPPAGLGAAVFMYTLRYSMQVHTECTGTVNTHIFPHGDKRIYCAYV